MFFTSLERSIFEKVLERFHNNGDSKILCPCKVELPTDRIYRGDALLALW